MSGSLTSIVLLLAARLSEGGRERHSSPMWFGSPPSLRAKNPQGQHGLPSVEKLQLSVTAEKQPGSQKHKLVLMQSNANSRRSAARGSDFADLLQADYLETPTDLPARTDASTASHASTGQEATTWALAEHARAVPTNPTDGVHVGAVLAHDGAAGAHREVCADALADMYQAVKGVLRHNVFGVSANETVPIGNTIIFRVVDDGHIKMVLTACDGTFIQSGYVHSTSDTWYDATTWQYYEYYVQNVRYQVQFLAEKRTSGTAAVDTGPGDAGAVGSLKGFFSDGGDSVGPWACAVLLLALAATVLSLYAARVLDLVALSFVFAAAGFLATLSVVIYLTIVTDIMWDSLAGKETCPYCCLAAAWSVLQAVAALCIVVAVPHLCRVCGGKDAPPPPPPPKRFPRVDFPRPLSPHATRLPGEEFLYSGDHYS